MYQRWLTSLPAAAACRGADETIFSSTCHQYLRTQRLGQAMFIPLDSIQVKPTNDKFRNFARGARLAIDVIEFDPQFDAAMQHACGNSLICDTMDVARYVCYDKQQDVKGQ